MVVANPPQTRTETEIQSPEVEIETQVQWHRRAGGPRRTNRQDLLILIGSVLTAIVLLAAGAVYWLNNQLDDITTSIPELETPVNQSVTNWLLVGTDSRDGISEDDPNAMTMVGGGEEDYSGKRTDTIMIARVDKDSGEVNLISVPRDLWVPIAGTARQGRINSAFVGEGGDERLIRTVESVLDLEIHHYAEINFVGFQALVDDIGGIPLWFDRALRDNGSGLDVPVPGCMTLDGSQALAFARARSMEYYDGQAWRIDGSGDLGRMSRQRFIMRKAVDIAGQKIDITSLDTIVRLIGTAGDNLLIDDTLSVDALVDFGRVFQGMAGEEITTHVLPTTRFRTEGGSSVLGLLPAETKNVTAIFRGEEPQEIEAEEASVSLVVSNGSRTPGQAGAVEAALSSLGFSIDEITNAETTDVTLITYGYGMEEGAERVARHMVVPAELVPDPEARHIQLITGKDFDGLLEQPRAKGSVNVPVVVLPEGVEPPPAPAAAAPAAAATIEQGILPGDPPAGTSCGS